MLVPGSTHRFPECPAAYLRTPADIVKLRVRRGGEPFAAHLVHGGVAVPDNLIASFAHEFKNGARTADSMSMLVRDLVFLRMAEENDRDRYEDELREQERQANARG